MQTKESKGIILYNRAYKESDRLVKIFTEEAGKRMFFVKQAPQSKLQSVIQPLTVADFIMTISDTGLSYIMDYKSIRAYPKISGDLFSLSYATYLLALTDAAISDKVLDPHLFAFLVKTLDLMEEGLDYEVLTLIFELQLLDRFGVKLNFHECAICHRVGLPFDFSHRIAGLLCPDHYQEDPNRSHLDPNVPYLLDRFQAVRFEDLKTISLKADLKKKLRVFMDAIYDDFVGIRLKSKQFIDDLEKWGQIMKPEE